MLLFFLRVLPHTVSNGGSVNWVAWRRPWPRTCFQLGVQFNLPTRFPIPDPSPAPVPVVDWGAKLLGSFVNMTLQRRFQFDCSPVPVLSKGILSLYLLRLDSIARVRPGLPFLAVRSLREQTAKNVSLGRDSVCRARLF